MKRVVFDADDFGMSPAVNRGIVRAVRSGPVREVSVCVTGRALDDAALMLPELGVGAGLHFSLTFGRALSGRLRGLTDATGRFLPLPVVLASCLARVPDRREVAGELRAQMEILEERGLSLGHLNGHHHVHVFPVVRDAVVDVLRAREPIHVRVPREALRTSPSARGTLLSGLSRGFVRHAAQRLPGFRSVPLVGLGLTGDERHSQHFAHLAARVPNGAEWLVHPREEGAERAALGARRPTSLELATLCDARTQALLAELGIVPSRFVELHS